MTQNCHAHLVDGRIFAAFAGRSPETWTALNGGYLFHAERGDGVIATVTPRNGNPLISVRFGETDEVVLFNAESLKLGRISVDIPPPLQAEYATWLEARDAEERALEEQRAQEALHRAKLEKQRQEVAAKYRKLLNRFSAPEALLLDDVGETPFGTILVRIAAGASLDESELSWLESHEQFRIVALYFSLRHDLHADLWDLVKACKYFRRARLPHRAVEITTCVRDVTESNRRAWGALQTSRGGAFRDMGNFTEAKRCADTAIANSPNSYHSHTLLGAICYDEGNYPEGDKHFAHAEELGASVRARYFEIRRILEQLSGKAHDRLVQHLLSVDPDQYGWARNYGE